MTAEEIYDLKQKQEEITERLNELAKEYSYDPFRFAAKLSEELEGAIFKCVGVKAAYEISERRNEE